MQSKESIKHAIDKKEIILQSEKRIKILRESFRKAVLLLGQNPVLLEPRYTGMVCAIFAGDDPVLASEFNKFIKESGRLNYYDIDELDKFFWGWLNEKYPEHFEEKGKGEELSGFSDGTSLKRLNEALKEELEEKYQREGEAKVQLAKDKIRKEVSKEFETKIKDIVQSSGKTSDSLNSMDAIIEKGGKKALDLLSDHIESAKGSTSKIKEGAEDLQSKVKKLEEEIQYDTIPGLYTVRIFSKKFQELSTRYGEKKIPFSLFFATVDNLEKYVTSADPMISRKIFLGIVQQVIGELQSHPKDIIPARYDVNLLGVLFPHTQLEDAFKIAAKVKNHIKEQKFHSKDGTPLELTLSIGLTEYTERDSIWFDDIPGGGKQISSTIFNRAMELLQKAKSEGGNKIKKEKKSDLI